MFTYIFPCFGRFLELFTFSEIDGPGVIEHPAWETSYAKCDSDANGETNRSNHLHQLFLAVFALASGLRRILAVVQNQMGIWTQIRPRFGRVCDAHVCTAGPPQRLVSGRPPTYVGKKGIKQRNTPTRVGVWEKNEDEENMDEGGQGKRTQDR